MEITHVNTASEAELDGMAEILMDGFSDDALLLRCSGNSLNNLRRGMRARVEKTIPRGGVWAAREQGKVVGLMICDLPGQESPEAISVAMSNATDSDPIPDDVRHWVKQEIRPKVEKLEHESFGPDGERDSMYVHFLAVDPSTRGKGVGRLLLQEAFKVADEQGVRTTLLNPKQMNLDIYGRLGFVEAGKTEIQAPDAKHPLWTMYREPVSKSA